MRNMTQANNPLHGIKLETIVTDLVERYGWEELGLRINIRCFTHDPSIKSSLRFLRKTDWAREKVEYLYLKANKLPLPAPKTAQANPAKASTRQGANNLTHNVKNSVKSSANKTVETNVSTSAEASQEGAAINSHIWGNIG
ncbi:MAG: VF530 family DNA-binding protein [Shewanella sp.]